MRTLVATTPTMVGPVSDHTQKRLINPISWLAVERNPVSIRR
jgi:hypothetical protein